MRYVYATEEMGGGDSDFDGIARAYGFDGIPMSIDGPIYSIDSHMQSGNNWRSYFYVGGPGRGVEP
jgi:hypothetical protein